MGNRNANARRKQRDNAYVYTDNRRNNDYAADNKSNGSINRRSNQQVQQPFNYHSYPNGYGINPSIPQTNSYPPKPNANPSSIVLRTIIDIVRYFLSFFYR